MLVFVVCVYLYRIWFCHAHIHSSIAFALWGRTCYLLRKLSTWRPFHLQLSYAHIFRVSLVSLPSKTFLMIPFFVYFYFYFFFKCVNCFEECRTISKQSIAKEDNYLQRLCSVVHYCLIKTNWNSCWLIAVERMEKEIQATIQGLGYSEKGVYFPEPDCFGSCFLILIFL